MKRTIMLLALVLALAACTSTPTGQVVSDAQGGDAQNVIVTVQGSKYVFSPSSVEAGKPVRLVFEQAPPGCARSFMIPSAGIREIVGAGSTIEFMPDSSVVDVMCSMNMYTGQLFVNG